MQFLIDLIRAVLHICNTQYLYNGSNLYIWENERYMQNPGMETRHK